MDKAEIIARTLTQMKRTFVNQPPHSYEPDEEEFVVSVLQDALPNGDIRTCEDFGHLDVECCGVCHEIPHFELSLIELPDGGKAWVCHAMKQALNPEDIEAPKKLSRCSRQSLANPTTL